MYHPPSKRVRFWRRFTTVSIMAIAVICGVAILTALTLGYGFSKEDGRIEQGGLLQLSSTPTGAAITINGAPFGSQTPTKFVSQPGDYALTMKRTGYHTWQKTVPIQAGNITWAAYPRLIPEKLSPVRTVEYPSTVASALPSGSSKRYAVLTSDQKPAVSIANLDSDEVKAKEFTLPETFYAAPTAEQPASHFEIEKWTGDENKVLLKHTYGSASATEWILFDYEDPENSVNINRTLGISGSLTDPAFTRGDGLELYALVDGSVRILDLSAQTLSRPLVEEVAEFRMYGDKFVLFVKKPADSHQEVGYVKKDYKQPRIVKNVAYDGKNTAQFDISRYYDKYHFLISHGNEAELLSSPSLPNDTTSDLKLKYVRTLALDNSIIDANMTDNGQFATIQDGSSFSTYNLEINQISKSALTHGDSAGPQKLEYLDGYMLWATNSGKLRTYEFDGKNQHDIMPIIPEFGATLSPSGKYLYGFSQVNDDTVALSRVQLLDITTN